MCSNGAAAVVRTRFATHCQTHQGYHDPHCGKGVSPLYADVPTVPPPAYMHETAAAWLCAHNPITLCLAHSADSSASRVL